MGILKNMPPVPYLIKILLLALVYFAAAKFGLSLAFATEQVTTVWPPTGIALAAVLLLGYRAWPGIFIGAFAANAVTSEPLSVAALIAVGNTLEAVAGGYLLKRLGFENSMEKVRDVVLLVVGAAVISTMISATIGTASLAHGGLVEWSSYASVWIVWWLGDMLGAIIFAPLILVWSERKPLHGHFEMAAMLCTLAAVSAFIFTNISVSSSYPLEYLVFPVMMWGAFRFSQRGTTAANTVVSGIAIYGTLNGYGPFLVSQYPEQNLLLLQMFMGVTAATFLMFAALNTERIRSEEARAKEMRRTEKMRTDFINVAAHELKTPLILIIGYTENLLEKRPDRRTKEYLKLILRGAERESRLVSDISDFARLESGTMRFEMNKTDIRKIVKNSVKAMSPKVSGSGLEIVVKTHDKPLHVTADGPRLEQATRNLLDNAIKFTRKGRITITAAAESNRAVVRVEDTGPGIEEKDIPNLFTEFFQADTSARRKQEGTGLGLTIVKKIVEAHGGSVLAESTGKGSAFSFTIPLRDKRDGV